MDMFYYKSEDVMRLVLKRDLLFFFLGMGICRYLGNKTNQEKNCRNEVNTTYVEILDQWMSLKNKNVSISRLLKEENCKKIAIYGLGMIGNHLYEELIDTEIDIVGIDQTEIYNNFKMSIYKPDEFPKDIDLIIVTPLKYETIYLKLRENYDGRIMSLQQILSMCENYLY